VAAISAIPQSAGLAQNYPNPFNRTTRIQYQIQQPGQVTLTIYNLQGQLVKILVDSDLSSGKYTANWDATDVAGQEVGSGIYCYRLQTSHEITVKKLILVK